MKLIFGQVIFDNNININVIASIIFTNFKWIMHPVIMMDSTGMNAEFEIRVSDAERVYKI